MFESNIVTQTQNMMLPYLRVCARKHATLAHILQCGQASCSHELSVMF